MAKLCGISLFVVLLSLAITSASGGQQKKIRQKREWIIPPHKLRENKDYTQQDYIAKIRSDEETRTKLQYFLTGAGADRPPVNLFTVNRENGWVKINGLLDREETPIYYLRGVAKYLNGSSAERDIDLRIVVEDENDCAPVFNFTIGSVYELSKKDTFVITVIATDGDEPGHLNSKISYHIVQDSHSGMFYINRETGHIYVMHNTLDREKKDKYTLTIRGTDRFGDANGISGTGTVVINILDVNDNIPTLENNIYECSVEENTKNVIVTKIQAFDADLIYSENWLAVFTIVSGNEANYFSIRTDNKTNEGILTLNKELDFEELKEIHLHVSVSNKAPYHSSVVITESKTYTVRVKVINQPEGPRFQPAVKVITISENSKSIVTEKKVIATYAAIDSDTLLIAKDVRYAKGQDVDNWLIIDERTAEIRLNKEVDYESKFVINKTYIAHIICITNETPAKTATGTIAIQVQDFNDHCPVLVHQSQRLCYEDHVVYVTAVDQDHFPNAAPFGFKVDTVRTKESWRVEHFNETTAILRSQTTLWPGVYNLFVDVWDQQAKICAAQMLRIDVCQCDASKVCLPEKTVTRFGVSGVFLMLLGLLLLLLVPLLLLFCLCGGTGAAGDFKAIPFDAKELLIAYNTEGQGEDKAMALLQMTKDHDDMLTTQQGVGGGQKWSDGRDGAMGAGESHWSTFNQYNQHEKEYHHHQQQHESQTDGGFMYVKRKGEYSKFDTYDGLALSDAFLGNYYSQKTGYAAKNQDMGDCPKVYDYEGRESYMGSFEDICSLIPEDNDLSFLNDLDIRFKTLAEICSGSTIEAEISTTTHVTSKPAPSTTHKDVNVQGTSSLLHSQKKGSSSTTIHTSGSQQASSSSSTGVYVHEKMVVPNQTLLVQQPTVYYAPATPIYVVEPHPTVLVTPSPVLGIQENLLVEEQRGSDAALREMQHYQSVVLVEKQPTKASVQAQGSVSGTLQIQQPTKASVLAQGNVSGTLQIVNTEVMQSTESHEVRRVIHPVRTAREREVCGPLEMRVPQSL